MPPYRDDRLQVRLPTSSVSSMVPRGRLPDSVSESRSIVSCRMGWDSVCIAAMPARAAIASWVSPAALGSERRNSARDRAGVAGVEAGGAGVHDWSASRKVISADGWSDG